MLTLQNVQDIWAKFTVWLSNYFWTVDTFVQIVIVATSFIIAGIFYRMVKGGVTSAIDKAEMPISVKRTASNLYKLLFSLFALIIIFFMTMMTHSDLVGMSTSLNEGVMKLLLAWIISRVALQFVENGFIRNLLLFTILTITGLSVFGILDETSTTLDAVGFSFGKARFSALALIKGAMSIFILLYMALFASAFLERRVLRTKSLTRSTQVLTIKVMRVVLILFAVLIGVTSAGIDLSILTVFSGAVGLGVGFGLQKVISNLFSGMLLLVDKSITPGDIIELENGTFGWVNHMAARYTEVVTRNNKSYLIPNEDFITQRVINWSHGNRLIRLEVRFGVHYNSNPHHVVAIAAEAAKRPERVVDAPTPECMLHEMGDSSLNFILNFWIKDAEQGVMNIRGEVLLALWDAFKENNILIPYPHREVYLHHVEKSGN